MSSSGVTPMKTDLVPCFYTGQNPLRDKPAELTPRAIVRDYKKKGFGKFGASGQFFMFFARMAYVAETVMCDFRASARTILTFIKTSTQGERLHYEIPMAGDRGVFSRHHRNLLHPSHRVPEEVRMNWRPIPA